MSEGRAVTTITDVNTATMVIAGLADELGMARFGRVQDDSTLVRDVGEHLSGVDSLGGGFPSGRIAAI